VVQPATLGIIVILGGRFLSWERKASGERGDDARLAYEEVKWARGQTLVFATHHGATQEAQPPQTGILLPLDAGVNALPWDRQVEAN